MLSTVSARDEEGLAGPAPSRGKPSLIAEEGVVEV
jgi:hypothetical protein